MLNLILLVITVVLFYRWINKTESPPNLAHEQITQDIKLQDFTKDELEKFNGITDESIYIAIKGLVFDVTRSKHFYGPNGAYGIFAGKDASLGMAKNDTDESILVTTDSIDLTPEELESLDHWLDFFKIK
jgi:membrane-associated progesterone receptor component